MTDDIEEYESSAVTAPDNTHSPIPYAVPTSLGDELTFPVELLEAKVGLRTNGVNYTVTYELPMLAAQPLEMLSGGSGDEMGVDVYWKPDGGEEELIGVGVTVEHVTTRRDADRAWRCKSQFKLAATEIRRGIGALMAAFYRTSDDPFACRGTFRLVPTVE